MVYTPLEENEDFQVLTNETYSGLIYIYNECLCDKSAFGLHHGEILAIGTDDGDLFTTCDTGGEASYRGGSPPCKMTFWDGVRHWWLTFQKKVNSLWTGTFGGGGGGGGGEGGGGSGFTWQEIFQIGAPG